jgi:hypothetical protein
VQLPDDCGVGTGNFYFYDATTGKWDVKTVGITSFKGATSYWFYSTKYCPVVTVMASGEVAAGDITLNKNEWNHVGAPKSVMNMADMNNMRCSNCAGTNYKCSSMKVLYYDTAASQFKDATEITAQDGRGYRVQCIGS